MLALCFVRLTLRTVLRNPDAYTDRVASLLMDKSFVFSFLFLLEKKIHAKCSVRLQLCEAGDVMSLDHVPAVF